MKARYKALVVIILLWIGMSYEGSRDTIPVTGNRYNTTLEEQIHLYELGLIDDLPDLDIDPVGRRRGIPHSAYQGNWFVRSGRSIGNALQAFVRETLRGLVRFFDGIIA